MFTLLAAAFSGVATASGFQLLEQNASGIGNAYAGSAAVAEMHEAELLLQPAEKQTQQNAYHGTYR